MAGPKGGSASRPKAALAGNLGRNGPAPVNVQFGTTGKPVPIKAAAIAQAKASGGRVYEDGSVSRPSTVGNFGRSKPMPKAPQPNARAVERANPNARFKRGAVGPPTGQTRARPTTPHPAAKAKTLPRPPARR